MPPRAPMTSQRMGEALFLSGAIDEHARLTELLEQVESNRLVLDLGGITFINSIGVREWIRMQQVALASEITIELRRVAIPIIHQLNIVVATRGTSIVTSFYAPYFCEDCDNEIDALLDVTVNGKDLAKLNAPAMTCPKCGEALEFSETPQIYFSVLAGG